MINFDSLYPVSWKTFLDFHSLVQMSFEWEFFSQNTKFVQLSIFSYLSLQIE